MRIDVSAATGDDQEPAVRVWQAANLARGLKPSPARVERVRDKLRASDALLVVARSDGGVIGMTLAEQARLGDGAGAIRSGAGHVSMVFVDPLEQGAGVGRALLAGLHRGAEARGWVELAVWTRRANARAQRLYRSAGYRPTGRIRELPTGEAILQLRLTRTPSQVRSITLLMFT